MKFLNAGDPARQAACGDRRPIHVNLDDRHEPCHDIDDVYKTAMRMSDIWPGTRTLEPQSSPSISRIASLKDLSPFSKDIAHFRFER